MSENLRAMFVELPDNSHLWVVGMFLFVAVLIFPIRAQVPPPKIVSPASTPIKADPTPTPRGVRLELLENDQELKTVYLGIVSTHVGRLTGEMWTLTHDYESKEEVDRVMTLLVDFLKAVESNDPLNLENLGGATGFKRKFSEFLVSKDHAVRSFSLFILGAAGDRTYSGKIAEFVRERDASFNDRWSGNPNFSRGRAAVALGMLGASEYKSEIAKLLKSKNQYDRSGAISALTRLGAVEYTNEIVGLLADQNLAYDDDDSPLYFLFDTKQSVKYKNEIVKAMFGESREKIPESAAYLLAAINAKEHAKDIAQLLKKEFRQGGAAKALAVLGATEYADEIAKLLNSESGLTRTDAVTALAILNSKKYQSKIVDIFKKDPESYVKSNAAQSLLLMGFPQYYRAGSNGQPDLGKPPSFLDMDFHYFVLDKIHFFNDKLRDNLK